MELKLRTRSILANVGLLDRLVNTLLMLFRILEKRRHGSIACMHLLAQHVLLRLVNHEACSYLENSSGDQSALLARNGANVFVRSYDACRKAGYCHCPSNVKRLYRLSFHL